MLEGSLRSTTQETGEGKHLHAEEEADEELGADPDARKEDVEAGLE